METGWFYFYLLNFSVLKILLDNEANKTKLFNFAETSAAATQTNNVPAAKQPEPLFVAVPPRPSRVLHSDAYLR